MGIKTPDHIIDKCYKYKEEGKTNQEIAEILTDEGFKISRKTVRSILKSSQKRADKINSNTHYDEKSNTLQIWNDYGDRVMSADELLNKMNVDRNKWAIERQVVNKYEQASKGPDNNPIITELFQVKVRLKRVGGLIDMQEYKDIVLNSIKDIKIDKIEYPEGPKDNMLLIKIFDAHLEKMCWELETGDEYNIDIARKRYIDSIVRLLSLAKPFSFDKIVLPIGNDFFNSDNKFSTTTSGTPQDNSTHWKNVFKIGSNLMIQGISLLKQVAPVEVVLVPGNHDEQRMYYLGDLLELVFANDPNVIIDNSPSPRKYVEYGKSILGFTHGDKEKKETLPLLMLNENKHRLADKEFFDWFLGHLHTAKRFMSELGNEYNGVHIHYEPSIAGTDSWHHGKGYTGNRKAARATIYNKEQGPIVQNLTQYF